MMFLSWLLSPLPCHGERQHHQSKKRTETEQRALRLLENARETSAQFSPEMKAYLLWKVAEAYGKLEPARRESLLKDAFTATRGIADVTPGWGGCRNKLQGCGIKIGLQSGVLSAMVSVSEIVELLPLAEPKAQQDVRKSLLSRYIARKDFAKAKDTIAHLAGDGDFPFRSAADLISALPRTAASERSAIFTQALDFYRQHDEPPPSVSYEDFAGMILRLDRDLPAEMLLDATEAVLAKAKDAELNNSFRLSVSGPEGAQASFSSIYEYRLFQLLPLLKSLDASKAERLLKDDREARGMLDAYPNGIRGIVPVPPSISEKERKETGLVQMSYGTSAPSPADPEQQLRQALKSKQQEIIRESKTDPAHALSQAALLPGCVPVSSRYGEGQDCPRSETLLKIARMVGKNDLDLAKEALIEARKTARSALPLKEATLRNDAQDQYMQLGLLNEAESTIEEATRTAEELYRLDNDADNPNTVFKAAWPSTSEWRHCIQTAAKVSPRLPDSIIVGIRDTEISNLQKVYYAAALLGVIEGPMDTGVDNRDETFLWSF